MKTIVAATDFSEDSVNAVHYAADMAMSIDAHLLLLHVCEYPVAVNELQVQYYSMQQVQEAAAKEMEELQDNISKRCNGTLKVNTLVQEGDIIECIIAACSNNNTFAVVMGRTDRGSLERWLVGDGNLPAMRKLQWPLVTVPHGARFNGIRNIGLACDFRDVTETLPAAEIKNILQDTHANLHVLHVSADNGDAFSSKKIEASGWFQDLMSDCKPHYHFIKGTDAEAEIIAFADQQQLDLLIVIPKKHGFLEKIFRHSHSKQLVLHAHVPVMAIHE